MSDTDPLTSKCPDDGAVGKSSGEHIENLDLLGEGGVRQVPCHELHSSLMLRKVLFQHLIILVQLGLDRANTQLHVNVEICGHSGHLANLLKYYSFLGLSPGVG